MAEKKLSEFLPARTPLSTDLVPTLRTGDPAGIANDVSTITAILALGGGGTPGGSSGQVQYNNAGAFGGFATTDGEALKLTVDNPTLSGNTTYRYGFNITATYDSTTVDPLFANQDGMAIELTSLNGQNQYGGGTNAKQSFFNLQNSHINYAAGQTFNQSNTQYAFGMGDSFSESLALYVAGGIYAGGDEGAGFWTTSFTHYQAPLTTTITSVVTPATISTSLTQAVIASQTTQTVTVASSAGVSAGQWIVVDYADGSNIEAVKVTAVAAGALTGVFRSNHSNGDPIRPATVLNIDSAFGFGQGRAVINLSASAYSTGTATPTAGSTTVTGTGTAWSNTMVGGDSHIPGYISFTEDDVDLTAYGSTGTLLKGWYPIVTVASGTSLTLSRLDVLGQAGFPANTHVSGASAYTIRPGAPILMFDGSPSTIVLDTNVFTWTPGQTIQCAHSVNNNWGGLYLRFSPLMPGRYDHGILLRNTGQFDITAGLIVDATNLGHWTTGVDISNTINGILVAGSNHALVISQEAAHPADILWNILGSGPSISGNTNFGDGANNLVLSAKGYSYPPYASGAQANPAVLSLNSSVNELRWNGFTSLYVPSTGGNAYSLFYANDSNEEGLIFRHSATSVTAPTALLAGHKLGRIYFQGYGSGYATGAKIQADAEENWSGSANGARLVFFTTPKTTATNVEHLAVEASGLLSFGGNTASFPGLKRSGTELHARLADDSAMATMRMAAFVAVNDAYANAFVAFGDTTGVASTTSLTNVANTTVTNTYVVKGGQTASTPNTGWIKIYVGTATAWVPYWANATP